MTDETLDFNAGKILFELVNETLIPKKNCKEAIEVLRKQFIETKDNSILKFICDNLVFERSKIDYQFLYDISMDVEEIKDSDEITVLNPDHYDEIIRTKLRLTDEELDKIIKTSGYMELKKIEDKAYFNRFYSIPYNKNDFLNSNIRINLDYCFNFNEDVDYPSRLLKFFIPSVIAGRSLPPIVTCCSYYVSYWGTYEKLEKIGKYCSKCGLNDSISDHLKEKKIAILLEYLDHSRGEFVIKYDNFYYYITLSHYFYQVKKDLKKSIFYLKKAEKLKGANEQFFILTQGYLMNKVFEVLPPSLKFLIDKEVPIE